MEYNHRDLRFNLCDFPRYNFSKLVVMAVVVVELFLGWWIFPRKRQCDHEQYFPRLIFPFPFILFWLYSKIHQLLRSKFTCVSNIFKPFLQWIVLLWIKLLSMCIYVYTIYIYIQYKFQAHMEINTEMRVCSGKMFESTVYDIYYASEAVTVCNKR